MINYCFALRQLQYLFHLALKLNSYNQIVFESSLVNSLILESWSARANLTSFSFGVIKSNFLKSKIFPHLEATWLSATLMVFFFINLDKSLIFVLLNFYLNL